MEKEHDFQGERNIEQEQKTSEKKSTFIIGSSSLIITIIATLTGVINKVCNNLVLKWILIGFAGFLFIVSIKIYLDTKDAEVMARNYKRFNFGCLAISTLFIVIAVAGGIESSLMKGSDDTTFGLNGCAVSPCPTITPTPIISAPADKIAAGRDFTILLKSDGRVQTFGDANIDTSGWENIIQVAAYGDHAVGLCASGKVVSTGCDNHGECETSTWSDVRQVAACYCGTIGVTNKGEILYTGSFQNNMIDCTKWKGVAKILGAEKHIVALTKRGELLTLGNNEYGQLDVEAVSAVVTGAAANDSTFIVCAGQTKTVLADGPILSTFLAGMYTQWVCVQMAPLFARVVMKTVNATLRIGQTLSQSARVSIIRLGFARMERS